MEVAVAIAVVANSQTAPSEITPPLTALVTETYHPVQGLRHLELKSCLLDITDERL